MSYRHGEEHYKKGSSSSSSREPRSRRSRSPIDDRFRGERSRDRSRDRNSDGRREAFSDRAHNRDRDFHTREKLRDRNHDVTNSRRHHSDSSSDSSDLDTNSKSPDIPPPPPPPRISKVSMAFKPAGIQMKVGSFKMGSTKTIAPPIVKPTGGVATAFNQDSEEEEEEMPSEARMRMRNIGRETPTSAGPNSFGKTKQGFCDSKKIFEKNLRAAMEKE